MAAAVLSPLPVKEPANPCGSCDEAYDYEEVDLRADCVEFARDEGNIINYGRIGFRLRFVSAASLS